MTSFAQSGLIGGSSLHSGWAADDPGTVMARGGHRIDLLIVAVVFLYVTALVELASTATTQTLIGAEGQDAASAVGAASFLIRVLGLAAVVGMFAWLQRCWHGPIEGLASVAGRVSRRVLLLRWVGPRLLLGAALGLVVVATAAATGADMAQLAIGVAALPLALLELVLLWPNLSVLGRRLHDMGGSAWWLLLLGVPLANLGLLLVLLCRGGQAGPNRFGPAPA